MVVAERSHQWQLPGVEEKYKIYAHWNVFVVAV